MSESPVVCRDIKPEGIKSCFRDYERVYHRRGGYCDENRFWRDGSVKFQGEMYFPGEALAGVLVGWVEVAGAIWLIWFRPVEVAIDDALSRSLWPNGNPDSLTVLPIRPV